MPIISSVPALNSIVKGVGATFTLDKAELLLVPSVAADPYFSDDTNWATVQLNYQSSVGNQPEAVVFNALLVSPTGLFEVVTNARNIFLIKSISIVDSQGGIFLVTRSELTVVDFDVDMTPAPLSSFDWDLLQGNASTSGGGQLQNNGGGTSWINAGYYNVGLLGDFTFTCVLDYSDPSDTMVGYAKSAPTIGGEFISIAYRAVYFHSILTGWQEGANTGVIAGWEGLAVYTCEIKRVSGVLTVKVNGNAGLTENYTGPVYLGATIFQGTATSNVVSATLVETPAPPSIAPFSSVWMTKGDYYAPDNGSINFELSNSGYTSTCICPFYNEGFMMLNYADIAVPMTGGKFYKELTCDAVGQFISFKTFSIAFRNNAPTTVFIRNASPLNNADNQYQILYQANDANMLYAQVGTGASPAVIPPTPTINIGDRIGIAIDFDSPTKDLYLSINGVFVNGADPTTGIGKIEITTAFPDLPLGLSAYFYVVSYGSDAFGSTAAAWTFNPSPLYKPIGYTNI